MERQYFNREATKLQLNCQDLTLSEFLMKSTNFLDTKNIRINLNECNLCGACVENCPRYLYRIHSDRLHIVVDFDKECIMCMHCASVCPTGAIEPKHYSAETATEIRSNLPDFSAFSHLVKVRKSTRTFLEKRIPEQTLNKLLDLAHNSPTGHNERNLELTIVQNPEILKKVSRKLFLKAKALVEDYERKELKLNRNTDDFKHIEMQVKGFKKYFIQIEDGRDPWKWGAQLVIFHGPKSSVSLIPNCSLAAGHLMLGAELLSLSTCPLGYLTALLNQHGEVAQLVKIPQDHQVGFSLALGYSEVSYHKIYSKKPFKVQWL